jgi:hypothetical protein
MGITWVGGLEGERHFGAPLGAVRHVGESTARLAIESRPNRAICVVRDTSIPTDLPPAAKVNGLVSDVRDDDRGGNQPSDHSAL